MVEHASQVRKAGKRTAFVAFTVSVLMALPSLAHATPSQEDIDRAQAAENAARMSVAQIEVELANVQKTAQDALMHSVQITEQYNAAVETRDAAKATADAAREDARKAQADFEAAKVRIASVALTAYREGGSPLDSLSPYLQADGLRAVETKQATISTASTQADSRMQEVAALEQVANVMQAAADRAVQKEEAAVASVESAAQQAQTAYDQAIAIQQQTEVQRQVLMEELARKQGTTVALIEERQVYLEEQRRIAAAQEAERRAAEAARIAEEQRRQAEAARQAQEAAARRAVSSAATSRPSSSSSSAAASSSSTPSVSSSGRAQGAINFALSKVGLPYIWGASGPAGYDCSGLTSSAWASQGVYIPRTAANQYYGGTQIPYSQKQPGDLIFWGYPAYHVAMYLGDGMMVEAPVPGQTVRVTSIWGSPNAYVVRY